MITQSSNVTQHCTVLVWSGGLKEGGILGNDGGKSRYREEEERSEAEGTESIEIQRLEPTNSGGLCDKPHKMDRIQGVCGPEGCCACCVLPTPRQCGRYKQFLHWYFLTLRVVRQLVQLSHLKRQHGSLLARPLPLHLKSGCFFFFLAH